MGNTPSVDDIGNAFDPTKNGVGDALDPNKNGVSDGMKVAADGTTKLFNGGYNGDITGAFDQLGNMINGGINFLKDKITCFVDYLKDLSESFPRALNDIGDNVKNVAVTTGDNAKTFGSSFGEIVNKFFEIFGEDLIIFFKYLGFNINIIFEYLDCAASKIGNFAICFKYYILVLIGKILYFPFAVLVYVFCLQSFEKLTWDFIDSLDSIFYSFMKFSLIHFSPSVIGDCFECGKQSTDSCPNKPKFEPMPEFTDFPDKSNFKLNNIKGELQPYDPFDANKYQDLFSNLQDPGKEFHSMDC